MKEKLYKVRLRNDRGVNVSEVVAVISSDETISQLQSHAHIVEVIGEFTGKYDSKELDKEGFTCSFEDAVAAVESVEEVAGEEVEKSKTKKK